MQSRRHVLGLLASTPFAASCGESAEDYAASWRSPGVGESDPRRYALAHAILAPNPHNTQPWLVELRGEDELLLYCDLDRRLPFTDPLDRQITLGFGCFLELLRIAAAQQGRAAEIATFPQGAPSGRLDERPLALVRFNAAANIAPDPLFAQISARRTNRSAFDAGRIPTDDELREIERAVVSSGEAPLIVRTTNLSADVDKIRDFIVWPAFDREMRTEGAQRETYRWLRFGKEERARHRDGLYVDVPVPGVLRALGMLDEADIVDPESDASKRAARDWKRKVDSAPAFMWLTTPDDAPATRLLAGMAYARMNLAATAAGLAMHPWSQALQEYAEMADLYAEARTALGASGSETVQMLARVGYADAVEPSARRAPGDFIRP
jgi:hypothetical protein